MATKEDKYEDNAEGKYYCDTECIDCDLCRGQRREFHPQ